MPLLILIFSTLTSLAQDQNFELKGAFGKNVNTKKPISYTLTWQERQGIAQGKYRDDFHGSSSLVKGITSDLGKIFIVTFQKEAKGVRTIMFLTPEEKRVKGPSTIPVSVIARDSSGTPVMTIASTGQLNPPPSAQAQEEAPCREGFGVLSGVCGIYSGIIQEEVDSAKRCDLAGKNELRLGITENASVVLLLGAASEIVETPAHKLGRLPAETTETRIDVLNRQCRPLPGTTFPDDDCKLLDLQGEFTDRQGRKHFVGSYSITDEKTRETCRYSLSLDQEKNSEE